MLYLVNMASNEKNHRKTENEIQLSTKNIQKQARNHRKRMTSCKSLTNISQTWAMYLGARFKGTKDVG